ncbi:receptor-like protein EIX2 [Senna tora]|uniref:Receptor-like protein EIX2 n=1 Tax=Senna tora TaxID=362788 RepID=A0A834T627_9FABA|nr:receptor-like protein EIX2 [Senna tora]
MMKDMESLDLSHNKFHGKIPQDISSLFFLSDLNLSYNNFNGQIPIGTQLQGFDASSFIGIPELCGAPLNNCTEPDQKQKQKELEEGDKVDNFWKSLYLGMGVGFAAGFWMVSGSIFFIRPWRHRFFRCLQDKDVLITWMEKFTLVNMVVKLGFKCSVNYRICDFHTAAATAKAPVDPATTIGHCKSNPSNPFISLSMPFTPPLTASSAFSFSVLITFSASLTSSCNFEIFDSILLTFSSDSLTASSKLSFSSIHSSNLDPPTVATFSNSSTLCLNPQISLSFSPTISLNSSSTLIFLLLSSISFIPEIPIFLSKSLAFISFSAFSCFNPSTSLSNSITLDSFSTKTLLNSADSALASSAAPISDIASS